MVEPPTNRGYVLVAEDNETNMLVLRLMLEGAGYTLLEATDGVSAVEAALSKNPDLVLMDLMMPRMDGISAAREILRRTSGKPPKMLAVTGNVLESIRRECVRAGFDGVILKPVNARELLETVARLLVRGSATCMH